MSELSSSKWLKAPSKRHLRLVREEREESPYPKACLFLRGGARLLDVLWALGLYRVCGDAGAVVALLYLLLADGMLNGQSLGKRMFGIKVMQLPLKAAARHRDSALRNAPWALIVLLGMMPQPLGLRAFCAALVAIGGAEALSVLRDPLGRRLGDRWSQTQVVDAKVVAGSTVASAGLRADASVSRRLSAA